MTEERMIESRTLDLGRQIWLEPGQEALAKVSSVVDGDRTIVTGYELWVRPIKRCGALGHPSYEVGAITCQLNEGHEGPHEAWRHEGRSGDHHMWVRSLTDLSTATSGQLMNELRHRGFHIVPASKLEEAAVLLVEGRKIVLELQARVAALEQERDDARANAAVQATLAAQGLYREMEMRALRAEARVAALETALREMVDDADRTRAELSQHSQQGASNAIVALGMRLEKSARAALDGLLAEAAERPYTQADLDFFSDNADEYLAQRLAAEARVAALETALRDAATVIERMANGASRSECSPELDRVIAALDAPASAEEHPGSGLLLDNDTSHL